MKIISTDINFSTIGASFTYSYKYVLRIIVRCNNLVCKGICIRHKAGKPMGTGRYATGQKRCQICEIFIKWEGQWCPCCGYRLRAKPRNLRYKIKLRQSLDPISMGKEVSTNRGSIVDPVTA